MEIDGSSSLFLQSVGAGVCREELAGAARVAGLLVAMICDKAPPPRSRLVLLQISITCSSLYRLRLAPSRRSPHRAAKLKSLLCIYSARFA